MFNVVGLAFLKHHVVHVELKDAIQYHIFFTFTSPLFHMFATLFYLAMICFLNSRIAYQLNWCNLRTSNHPWIRCVIKRIACNGVVNVNEMTVESEPTNTSERLINNLGVRVFLQQWSDFFGYCSSYIFLMTCNRIGSVTVKSPGTMISRWLFVIWNS